MKHLQWLDKILEVQRQHNRVNSNHLLLAWTQLPFKQHLFQKPKMAKKTVAPCQVPFGGTACQRLEGTRGWYLAKSNEP